MEPTKYARNGQAHLAFRVRGDGAVPILVSAFGTISISSFDEQPRLARFLDRLTRFASLVLYDPRGIGLSDPLSSADGETVDQAIDDAVAVLDAAGVERAVVFGAFGFGPIAIELAARRPERVQALILDNTFARLARDDDYPEGIPSEALHRILEGTVDPNEGFDTNQMFQALAPSALDDSALQLWWEDAGRRGASPTAAALVQTPRFFADVRPALRSITAPTLVTHRRDASYIRVGHGRYLAQHIPGAEYIEMAGADQLFFTEPAEELIGAIEQLLTGRRSPAPAERRLATVLFTDIVGSTKRAADLGDRAWREVLDRHDAEMRGQLDRFGGVEVKMTGDGCLATFDSPTAALDCAQVVAAALSGLGTDIRAGIHTGEVEIRGEDIGGIGVHIAQRIMGLAAPGEVLVSRTVKDLVVGSGFRFEDRGAHPLKGVPEAWNLYAVIP